MELVAARHPLLDPAAVVPIDIPLSGVRVLVLSGANTGGKTVALKTLGLCALLHQCGLHVPAERARLPVYSDVLADIGDEQSITASLSTFSGHLRNLVQILAAATPSDARVARRGRRRHGSRSRARRSRAPCSTSSRSARR